MVQGPNGTMVADTGFFGKKNQDMMDAYPQVSQQMQDIIDNHRGDLKTPEAQLQYDSSMRRFAQIKKEEMGSAYDKAQIGWATDVNANNAKRDLDDISRDASNDNAFNGYLENLKTAYGKTAHINGLGDSGMSEAVRNANRDGWKARLESIAVQDPARAEKLAQENQAVLGTEYPQMAARFKQAAAHADVHAGVSAIVGKNFNSSTSALAANGQNNYGPVFSRYNQLLNGGDVQSALRLSEGMRTEPYWDVNHLRTGYGSDTVTRSDGSVETVNASTRITPADAERDLQRRTDLAATSAANTVGESWRGMTPAQHAALTSVVYNYGHLPNDIAAAAQSGDKQALAGAIVAHAGDNGGVNAQRRRAEAGAVLGGGAIAPASYTVTARSADRAAEQAQALTQNVSDTGAPAETPGLTPAAFTPTAGAPPTPAQPGPESPEDKIERLALAKDQSIADAWMHPDWTYEQKVMAEREIAATFTAATIAAQQDSKTLKIKKDAVVDKMYGYINNGNPQEAFNLIHDPNNGLDEKDRFTLAKTLEQASGQADPATLGPKYQDYLARVVAQPGAPERLGIGDTVKLYEAVNNHELTMRGAQELSHVIGSVQKSTDDYGNQIMMNTALARAKDKLMHEEDIGSFHVRDPNGLTAYENFTNKMIGEFNAYREKGYDPKGFKYFDPAEQDKLMQQIYPERERIMDRLKASGQAPQQDVPQPAPAGIPPEAWSVVMRKPPILGSGGPNAQIMPHQYWATAIQRLLSNPTQEEVDAFNRHYMGADGSNDGAAIIQALRSGGPAGVGAGLSAPPVPGTPGHAVAPPVLSEQSPEAAHAAQKIKSAVGDFIKMLPTLGAPDIGHMTLDQIRERYLGAVPTVKIGGPLPVYPSTKYQDEHPGKTLHIGIAP